MAAESNEALPMCVQGYDLHRIIEADVFSTCKMYEDRHGTIFEGKLDIDFLEYKKGEEILLYFIHTSQKIIVNNKLYEAYCLFKPCETPDVDDVYLDVAKDAIQKIKKESNDVSLRCSCGAMVCNCD